MSEGHVKLGPVGDIRPYTLDNIRQYSRINANQMAAKLGQGAGDYADLTSWTAFAMDDWQAGVGKKDPEAGGFLYGELETRWPNKMQLPLALLAANQADATNFYENTGYAPGVLKAESTVSVGTTQTVQRIAKCIKGNGSKLIGVHICLANDDDLDTVTVALYSSTGSPKKPNAAITTKTEVLDLSFGYGNHFIPFDDTLANGTYYHIVVYPTTAGETMTLPIDISSSDTSLDLVSTYNGSAWTGAYTGGRFLMEPVMSMPVATEEVSRLIYFPATGFMYAAAGAVLYKQETDTDQWEAVTSAFAADITDLHTDGEVLYIGLGDSTHFQTMDDVEAFTAASVAARLFTRWKGYLWRAVDNDVYYTADGVSWTGPIEVCPQGFAINGMAGQNDYLYAACDDSLYYIGFADLVYTVTPWGQLNPAEHFGAGMVNWQGALYIPIAQGIIRYDSGSMLPVGPDLGEGLPLFRSGNIGALATQNNWLYAIVQATGGQSTVWAYNGQGWHFIAVSPSADELYFTSVYYQRTTGRLYLGTNAGAIFYVVTPDSPNSTDIDTLQYTATYGSIEFDWYFGGLKDVQKDMESVTVLGDNIDEGNTVRVYWKDDGSEDVWEYLGEVAESGQELRWTDYSTRPNTKQIKLGFALYAKESIIYNGGPIVRAVRLKFHNMVTDVWRWNFSIRVSAGQTYTDGTPNSYTVAQMVEHLDSVTKQVAPVIYQDLDGIQYETKILEATRIVDKLEIIAGVQTPTYIYRVTAEQVTNAVYSG